jgi:hypothetical protein
MRWRKLLCSSVVGCTFLSGCMGDRQETSPPAPAVVRPQKADPPAPPTARNNYLDVLPEQPEDAASGSVAARIRATVNDVPIFDEEVQANGYQFLESIKGLPEPERTKKRREIYKEVLDQLIERELLIQDAQARLKKAGPAVLQKLQDAAEKEFDRRWVKSMKSSTGMSTDDALKDFLRKQGLSLDMIRRQWTRQFISSEYLRNRVMAKLDKLGHEQMLEYYDAHADEFKQDDAVEWQDLFVSAAGGKYPSREAARQMAEQIVARLKSGEDFAALCKQHDDGDASFRNGAGIGKKRGEIQPPDCEEHLFSMKAGDVGPIIEGANGYHVFKLVKRDFAGKKPFDVETQKDIKGKLRAAMYEREAKTIVNDLKRRAVIEYSRGVR